MLDGELVVSGDGRLDFMGLQRRIVAPKRCQEYAPLQPASSVAFDVLEVSAQDVRSRPAGEQRRILSHVLEPRRRRQVTPQTTDREQVGADGLRLRRGLLVPLARPEPVPLGVPMGAPRRAQRLEKAALDRP